MATRITDRAKLIASGTIKQNGATYAVYADHQVGQRIRMTYRNRYWLIMKAAGREILQSTQRETVYREWMSLIAANGVQATEG